MSTKVNSQVQKYAPSVQPVHESNEIFLAGGKFSSSSEDDDQRMDIDTDSSDDYENVEETA